VVTAVGAAARTSGPRSGDACRACDVSAPGTDSSDAGESPTGASKLSEEFSGGQAQAGSFPAGTTTRRSPSALRARGGRGAEFEIALTDAADLANARATRR